MPAEPRLPPECEDAIRMAQLIFDTATDCLMAHSIRAFQTYIWRKFHAQCDIVLQVKHNVKRMFFGKKSWTLLIQNGAILMVDCDETPDQQRVCIAHELYHLIISANAAKGNHSNQHKVLAPIQHGKSIEDVCDLFANELCTKHNDFYKSGDAQKRGVFHNLPIFSTDKNKP